jgi:hypothetical protein
MIQLDDGDRLVECRSCGAILVRNLTRQSTKVVPYDGELNDEERTALVLEGRYMMDAHCFYCPDR